MLLGLRIFFVEALNDPDYINFFILTKYGIFLVENKILFQYLEYIGSFGGFNTKIITKV